MKTLSIIILLGLSAGLAHQADAEPFNDRGLLWSDVAPAGSDRPREPARPELGSFNRRDQVYTREFGSVAELLF